MLRWCEKHSVGYVVGIAKNDRLGALADYQEIMNKASCLSLVSTLKTQDHRPRRQDNL
jgi:hypothetical protein